MKFKNGFIALLVTLVCIPSYAGEFRVSCFSSLSDCASKVTDLVTDKFTQRFPASRFKIAVVAEFQQYSDGGGVGYAVAGVSPVLKDNTTLFPIRRFASTVRIKDRTMSPYDVTKETEELLRRAVEQLMAACDSSPSCDVHTPYK